MAKTVIPDALKQAIMSGRLGLKGGVVMNGDTVVISGDECAIRPGSMNMGKGYAPPEYTWPPSPQPTPPTLFQKLCAALGGPYDTLAGFSPPIPFIVQEFPYEKKVMVILTVKGKPMRLEDDEEAFPSNELIGKIRLLLP